MKTLKTTIRSINCLLLMLCIAKLSALDLENTATGAWNNSAIWKNSATGLACGCIPTASDDVTIAVGVVDIPQGYNASAKQVVVNSNASLWIGNLFNSTTATLKVGPSNFEGVIVEPNANLRVNSADRLIINSILNLNPNVPKAALRNEGDVVVATSTSKIEINSSKAIGIHNSGQGSLFENNGQITIKDSNGNESDGIFNGANGMFENNATGVINIENIDGNLSQGIHNEYTFANFGEINIDDIEEVSGLICINNPNAIFANHGDLNITNTGAHGIRMYANGEFLNKPSGEVNINTANLTGVYNEQNFENEGNVFIENIATDQGIYNARTVNNSGLLTIDDVSNSNGILSTGNATFYINSGTTKISNTLFAGFLGEDNSITTNTGSMTISFIDETGIRIRSNADFDNSGDITINNSIGNSSHGINVKSGSVFKNLSGGSIDIDDINGNTSYGIFNEGTFENMVTGSVDIFRFSSDGIRNATTGSFTNSGGIVVSQNFSNSGSHGLNNRGTFINNETLDISRIFGVESEGIRNAGIFETNAGKIVIKTVSDSGILNLSGNSFTLKNGTLVDMDDVDLGIENSGNVISKDCTFFINNISQIGIHNQVQADMSFDGSTVTILNSDDNGILNEGAMEFINNSNASTSGIINEPLEVVLNASLDCQLGSVMDIQN